MRKWSASGPVFEGFQSRATPLFLKSFFFSSALWGSKSRGEFLGVVTSNSTLFFSHLVSIGFFFLIVLAVLCFKVLDVFFFA